MTKAWEPEVHEKNKKVFGMAMLCLYGIASWLWFPVPVEVLRRIFCDTKCNTCCVASCALLFYVDC